MSFAVTYTIKNDSRLIADSVKYYHSQGASLIFVFFDGSDNLTRLAVEDFAYVTARDSVPLSDVNDGSQWFAWIEEHWDSWFDLRKMLNTYWAALQAKAQGIDWLLSIDVDEILVENLDHTLGVNGLKNYFSTVPASIEQLSFLNYDVIPTQLHADFPFCSSVFFVQRPSQPVVFVWRVLRLFFSKFLRSSYWACWYDFYFYKLCTLGTWPRKLVHPKTLQTIPAGIFLSYYNGKSAIRLSSISRLRPYVHFWKAVSGRPPRTKSVSSMLLHYDLFDFDQYLMKFQQRPPHTIVKDFYDRYQIAQIARDLPVADSKNFFRSSFMIPTLELDTHLKRGNCIKVVNICEFFSKMNQVHDSLGNP